MQDIGIEATYCLTRHRKPLRWFAKKCALLAAVSAYAILLMQLSVTAVILLAGKSAARELAGALAPNLYLFLLSWLFVFTFSLALNLLSFSVAPRWLVPALLTVLFILILQMRIAMKSKTGWQWNPAIHFYLNCHAEFFVLCMAGVGGSGRSAAAGAEGLAFARLFQRAGRRTVCTQVLAGAAAGIWAIIGGLKWHILKSTIAPR